MYFSRIPYPFKWLFPKSAVWNFAFNKPDIYLTFDDGPNPSTTPFILDLLKKKDVKATFFCIGQNIENHPALYQRILDEGHATGNHTYSHLSGWKTSFENYISDFRKCETLCKSKLFRPPYGRMTKAQATEISKTHQIIMWSVLTGDFDVKRTPEKCLAVAKAQTKNGSVIIFHDSEKAKPRMEYALPRFIDFALEKGFCFEKIKMVK